MAKGNPNPISRKGKPSKYTKELKDMILGALDEVGGQAYLAEQAILNPTAFMALVGKTLPRDMKADINILTLESVLEQVRKK